MKRKIRRSYIAILALILIIAVAISLFDTTPDHSYSDSVQNVPAFSGEPYVVINNNEPKFSKKDLVTESYEFYSELDALGRCGYVMACIGVDLMPTEDRGNIGQVKPSGWHTVKYDFVDGKYLYNRCHLIGFQLTGENANKQNLITGTRYLNIEGMLPFENMVADYIKETKNHVLYRVTPVFDNENLLARGVQMEARSVEDDGAGISFNVYAYNSQPGVQIDYTTGESWEEGIENTGSADAHSTTYVLNTSSKKFHIESCTLAVDIKESNKDRYIGNREDLIADGYTPCKGCAP